MSKKKEFRPIVFGVEIGTGKKKEVQKFEIWRPKVNVPGHGVFDAKDLVDEKNKAGQLALAELVKRKSGVIRPVSKAVASNSDDPSDEDIIETLKADVSERDAKIESLNADVSDRDATIETLKSEVSVRDGKIVELEDRISELNDPEKVKDVADATKKGGK